jgi:diguanylate cyclase (GGDEF)-like protein
MSPLASEAGASVVCQALSDFDLHLAVLNQLQTGVYIVDRSRRILYWSSGAEKITGYLSQDVVGHFCHGDLMMHCDAMGKVLCGDGCPLIDVMMDGRVRECSVFFRHRHGHRLPVRVRAWVIRDPAGAIIGALEMFDEVNTGGETDLLEAFGCRDGMTEVAARRYGEMKMAHALEALNTFGIPFGWLRVELDGLEELERRFGHAMIDTAARMVASTLEGNVSRVDLVSCWGRGDFRIEVHRTAPQELADLAERLAVLVRVSNVEWWGDPFRVTVSIGGGMAEPSDTPESLEARVEAVFTNCRASGGNRAAMTHFVRIEPAPRSNLEMR